MAKKINITAELYAATVDGKLADAKQLFDSNMGKFQQDINEELMEKANAQPTLSTISDEEIRNIFNEC